MIFPAKHIVYWINSIFSVTVSYTSLEILYVFLLLLVCKLTFKRVDRLEKENAEKETDK